jgi:hypothetical protein
VLSCAQDQQGTLKIGDASILKQFLKIESNVAIAGQMVEALLTLAPQVQLQFKTNSDLAVRWQRLSGGVPDTHQGRTQ